MKNKKMGKLIKFALVLALILTVLYWLRSGNRNKVTDAGSFVVKQTITGSVTPDPSHNKSRSESSISQWFEQEAWAVRIAREGKSAEKDFRYFLARANLTGEQKSKFLALVSRKRFAVVRRKEGIASGEFRSAADGSEFYKRDSDLVEAEIKSLLGDSMYSDYGNEEQRIPVIRQVDAFARILAGKTRPLDPSVQELLTVTTAEEFEANGVRMAYSVVYSEGGKSGVVFLKDMISRQRAYKKALERISPQLSAEQIEALKRFQKDQVAGLMTEAYKKKK